MILLLAAVIITALAVVQNSPMIFFGLKESAIFSSPVSFLGILCGEIALIWAGYLGIRKRAWKKKVLLYIGWAFATLLLAELVLPASYFSIGIQQFKGRRVLNQIQLVKSSVEILASEKPGNRFALTYTLQFPKAGHYLTFPAEIKSGQIHNGGTYFIKIHPEYYDEEFTFEPGRSYDFTVVFDLKAESFDLSKETADIDICDSKGYFMNCRIIPIRLDGVPAAVAANPSPIAREPAVTADNSWDIAEKSIRIENLKLRSLQNKAGDPVSFSFAIINAGKKDVAVPEGKLDSLIYVNYGWEAISGVAKKSMASTGIALFNNAVMAGNAGFSVLAKNKLSPDEKVPMQDEIKPFKPLVPGNYKLHVFLFNKYSVEENGLVQELTQDFSVVP